MSEQKLGTEMDDLLSNPFGDIEIMNPATSVQKVSEKPARIIDTLTEENRQKALSLADQIDIRNHQAIIQYGTQAQSKLLNFSHTMLEQVQNKDVGEIGDILSELMRKLDHVNPDELAPEKRNFFSKLFGKISGSVHEILSKYQKTGAQIDRITVKAGALQKWAINR